MTVIDIRNFFTIRNVEIIDINKKYIYYAEEKNEEGHNNLFLLEYNRETRRERVIINYSLDDPTFVQHLFNLDESIILVLENGTESIWIFRINKKTGEETARIESKSVGSFFGCKAIDENNVIIYTVSNEKYKKLFEAYQKKTGCTRLAYMHDIDQDKKYLIENRVISGISPENIKIYKTEDEVKVLLLNPYGDEALKEKCYKNARWISTPIDDCIWTCTMKDLIQSVKNEEYKLKLKLIVKASIEGCVRYIGMDKDHLYLRVKNFKTKEEYICAYSETKDKMQVAYKFSESASDYYIDKEEAKVYKLIQKDDLTLIEGVVNSKVNGYYKTSIGKFVGCIEDRFIITNKVVLNKEEKYDFEYTSICDTRLKTEESFECKSVIKGDTLVLY